MSADLQADLQAAVKTWREESQPYPGESAADSARRSGFGYCAGELARILSVYPQPAPDFAASRLAEVQAVLAAFSWGYDDLQYALERIDAIVNRSEA